MASGRRGPGRAPPRAAIAAGRWRSPAPTAAWAGQRPGAAPRRISAGAQTTAPHERADPGAGVERGAEHRARPRAEARAPDQRIARAVLVGHGNDSTAASGPRSAWPNRITGGRSPLQAVHLPLHDATRCSEPLAGDGDRWPCPRHRAPFSFADRRARGADGPRLRVPPAVAVQDRRRRARRRRVGRRAARLLPVRRAGRVGRADHPRLLARAAAGEHRRGARASTPAAPVRRDRRGPARVAGRDRRDPALQRDRHRAAGRAAADRARAHRPSDRGHAPQRPRPPVGRRRAAGPPRRPAHRPLAPARAARRAARGADAVVADRRAAPDPAARRGRGPPQPVLLRGRPVRRGPGRAGRDRARAGRPARPAGAVLRLLDRRRHGRSPRGRRRHAGDRAAAAPHDRAAAVSHARGPARAHVQPLQPADPGLRGAAGVARAGRRGAAERRRPAPPPPRVGAAADQARLRPPPARQHADAARARAGVRRRAGDAPRPRAGARAPELPPRGERPHPAAAVAGRRLRLPPRGDRHPPGRGRRCARRRRRSCPATATPTSRAARRC